LASLRHQTKIGDGRRRAKAERAGLVGNQGFASGETLAVGPCRPPRHLLFGQAELAQPRQHFKILHRMDIAGERHRKGANLGAAQRILWQQRRFGWVSSSHSMIASDWVRIAPASFSSVGTSPCGLIAR